MEADGDVDINTGIRRSKVKESLKSQTTAMVIIGKAKWTSCVLHYKLKDWLNRSVGKGAGH